MRSPLAVAFLLGVNKFLTRCRKRTDVRSSCSAQPLQSVRPSSESIRPELGAHFKSQFALTCNDLTMQSVHIPLFFVWGDELRVPETGALAEWKKWAVFIYAYAIWLQGRKTTFWGKKYCAHFPYFPQWLPSSFPCDKLLHLRLRLLITFQFFTCRHLRSDTILRGAATPLIPK